jgi:hypothetical protein
MKAGALQEWNVYLSLNWNSKNGLTSHIFAVVSHHATAWW